MPRLKAVDADGHVLEPADLWTTRIERKHRDQAVRVVWNAAKQREEVAGEGRVILHRGVVGTGMAGQAFTTGERCACAAASNRSRRATALAGSSGPRRF